MDRDRRLSYLILKDVEENHRWSNISVGHFLAKEGADNPAFVRELVYGVIRNKTLLDYNISFYLKKPKLDTSAAIWLRMGFYQLSFMEGVKPYAAVSETVALAKAFKKGSEGFINGVLRNFQRDECKLKYPNYGSEPSADYLLIELSSKPNNGVHPTKTDDCKDLDHLQTTDDKALIKSFSVKYSAHESIVELLLNAYGKEQCEKILSESNKPAPLVLRVNTIKNTRDELIGKLTALGFEASFTDFCSTAIIADGSGILDTSLFKEGYFSVQGISSQMAIECAATKPGNTVIDLCAAPGGKSCAIAEAMKNKGEIFAFDVYPHRVELINKETSRLGLSIIKAAVADATELNNKLLGLADIVLCDVPCSGLGTLRENPEIKLRAVDKIDVQGQILKNGLCYLKQDGVLIYSTCTINPKENSELVRANLPSDFEIEEEKQLFTDGICDGFYICKIKRKSA